MNTKKAIVIGTEAGGLTAAAYLAKRYGFEVVALERAQQFGGFMNPFKRKKYEFDPGIHYIGQCAPGQMIHRLLGGLDIDASPMFAELDPDGFDSYRFGDFEIRMGNDVEQYRRRLLAAFPREEKGIDRFLDAANRVNAAARLSGKGPTLSDLKTVASAAPLARWARSTFADFLAWVTDDPHLRDVLAAPCGDYGEPPSRASALYGLALFAHYADGAYFPVGGSRAMRDSLLDAARGAGASFRRNTSVRQIVLENGKATGVITEEDEEIRADVVISAVDPTITYGSFLPEEAVPKKLKRKSERMEPSPATLCMFFGMSRDLRDYGLGRFNIWDYADWDIEATYRPLYEGRIPEDPMLFLSPNSLKDPSGSLAPEGHSTLEVVTFAPYGLFRKWDGERAMFRSAEYVEYKHRIGDRIRASLDRRYPGLIGDVVVEEIATPVSNTWYVGSPEGGVYGPAATPDQSLLFRFAPKTPIENLFLAGSGVLGGGIAPCMQSGRIAAALCKGYLS